MAEAIDLNSQEEGRSADIDEQRLINALEANIVESDTIQGSEISEQRQRNHIFYSGDRLGNEKSNRSQHMSLDVLDSVESQKSYYLESFYSGRRTVQFLPENDKDQTAPLATEYVNQVFNDENDGYEFTRDSLHDAMVAKKAVAYVHWLEDDEEVTESLPQPIPQQHVQMLAQQEGIEIVDVQPVPGPQGMLASVTIKRMKDTSSTVVELVQPERFYRDPNVAYIKDAMFAGFQEDISRHELVDLGYDEEEVMELNLDYRFRQNEEDAARKAHDSSWSRARRHKRPQEQEIVTVYTTFSYLDMTNYMPERRVDDSIAGTRLYKFVWSQGKLLKLPENGEAFIEVEDGMPFVEWTQYKISHSEYGLCEADVEADIQWSKSNIIRLAIDREAMGNTGRWKAKHGFIKNPRELLDNNIGSVLWMKDPQNDLVQLDPPVASQYTFPLIEELNTEKENRNGLSRLAKGLNADAVSKQNADNMVERLTNASNRRVMKGVRDFAESYLKPIFIRIYNLGVKYDKEPRTAEVGGKWVQMTPSQWPERSKCRVDVALTPEQATQQGMFLLQMDQRLSQDPKVAPLYGLEQKHALLDDVFDMAGIGDTSRYMKQPDDPQVIQGLQMQQQEGEKMQQMQQTMLMMDLENKQLTSQLAIQRDEREWMKTRSDAVFNQVKTTDMQEDNELDRDRLNFDRAKAAAEYLLEQRQERPAAIG